MVGWHWIWSDEDLDQCWVEILEIWHFAQFKEALLEDPTSKRLWKSNNVEEIRKVQLSTDWSKEGDYGYAPEAS